MYTHNIIIQIYIYIYIYIYLNTYSSVESANTMYSIRLKNESPTYLKPSNLGQTCAQLAQAQNMSTLARHAPAAVNDV